MRKQSDFNTEKNNRRDKQKKVRKSESKMKERNKRENTTPSLSK